VGGNGIGRAEGVSHRMTSEVSDTLLVRLNRVKEAVVQVQLS